MQLPIFVGPVKFADLVLVVLIVPWLIILHYTTSDKQIFFGRGYLI